MHGPGDTHDPWLDPNAVRTGTPASPAPSEAQARDALGMTLSRDTPGSRGHHRSHGPTDPPPATTLDQARAAIAWTLIAACTLVLIVVQSLGMSELQDQTSQDPRPGFGALSAARYSVGLEQLLGVRSSDTLEAFSVAVGDSPFVLNNQTRKVILAAEAAPAADLSRELDALRLARETLAPVDPAPMAGQDAAMVLRIYQESYTPTAPEIAGLTQRHGWFGEIAATYNLPQNDPAHIAPRRSGKVVVLALFGLGGGVALAGLTGTALLILFIVFLATGKLHLHGPRGPAGHRTAYLEATALFLVLFIGLQVVFGLVQALTGMDMTLAMLVGVAGALLWPVVVGVRWAAYKTDMGYHTGRGLFREVGAGAVGYLAGLPIVAVGYGMTTLLSQFVEAGGDHPMQYELMDGGYTLWLTFGAAVIWAPLVEESVFRSAFYRHIRQRRGWGGWALATGITAFIFAAIHPQGWVGVPVLMSIAIVFAAMREWRGTIVPSMVAHALHNGTLCLMMAIMLFA